MNRSPDPLRVGIMGCSSFALRAMVPALVSSPGLRLAAIASRDADKARRAAEPWNCRAWGSYGALAADPQVDLIYMPLPTGLHEQWVHRALDAGKHVLVEKSLSDGLASARRMVDHARQAGRLLLENFLFLRHGQFAWVRERLAEGAVGELKFFRAAFTIPPFGDGNFRYQAALGGGALLDAGAYMIRSTLAFLGDDLELLAATREMSAVRGVDVRGSAVFRNRAGVLAQVLWGFDTHYQCTCDWQGTSGRILCERALTPPPDCEPPVRLERGRERQDLHLPADNHYRNQWQHVADAVRDPAAIAESQEEALLQARWLDAVVALGRASGIRGSSTLDTRLA